MEFRDLHYLIAIAQAKSISKAAQGLFMSQSSLSQALRLMEDELGGKLFTRTSSGVRPTQAGELMIQRAQKILGEYHQAQQIIQDMENLESGRVDFGISTFRGSYLLPPALCQFYQRYPGIRVEIREENSMALEQLLIAGHLDLALIALPPTKLKDEVDLLLQDEILLVVSHDHPVNTLSRVRELDSGEIRRYVELEDTMNYDYILSDYDTILGSMSRSVFSHRGLVPRVRNGNLTAPFAAAMARAGLGIAFTYRSCREDYPHTQYYSIGSDGVFLNLGLAFPPGQYRSRAALALADTLKRHYQSGTF